MPRHPIGSNTGNTSGSSSSASSFWSNFGQGVHDTFGQYLSSWRDMFFGGGLWNDLTGKSNTTAQNTAAAALQEDSQAFNAEEAQKERDWQTEMSNTAYQRSVADLKAAGLNPWLAVGNGASSGVSASASSAIAGAQASNVNGLAAVGTAAAGIGILIKALKSIKK